MSNGETAKHSAETSPRLTARMTGAAYFFSVLTAVAGERFLHGSVAFAAGLIAIACMVAVTLLFYSLLKPVNKNLAFLAASLNLVCLALETLRWHPWGVNLAIAFHGLYCLLIGALLVRSTFLPRTLGLLMAIAGLGWLTLMSPSLADHLSPWNQAAGFLGEGLPMLWLLVMGVNVQHWKEQAGASGMSIHT